VPAAAGSELDRWLRGGRATAAIVRPDRVVMQAGRDTGAIRDAMPSFFGVQGALDESEG
jgi:3-(3-hydroxy-phenyl)propionate hydroxylase